MDKKKGYGMLVLMFMLFFILLFYKEYSKTEAKKRKAREQQEREEEAAIMQAIEGKQYKDWEVKANRILDPINLLGFR